MTSRRADSELDPSLAGRFEFLARKAPDRLAVRHDALELSYGDLNRRANQVAHAIQRHLNDAPEPVVVLLEAPVHHVVAQLGILKTGKFCVPMDVHFPASRKARILDDSGARLIVTERGHESCARELARGQRQVLTCDALDDGLPVENPGRRVDPQSPAYVLYTSGSTGRPRGVLQTHRSLSHVARLYHRDLGVGQEDRVTTPTSLAYTGTLWALLGSLMNGAAFVCTRLESPRAFVETLAREGVTIAQLIVTLLRQLLESLDGPPELPLLRRVYTGGEALHRDDVSRFAGIFPRCGLLYNFGSTEAGIITHLEVDLERARQGRFQQDPDDAAFPVGYPVEGTEALLVDESGVVAPGTPEGVIVVRGPSLADGYWRDAELTADRFRTGADGDTRRVYRTGDVGRLRPDGCLVHLGREDSQVKVRGYRINLEEVEGALRSLPGVAGVAVRVSEDRKGKGRIIAYVERKDAGGPSVKELRARLEAALPAYMIPSLFIFLDRLPVGAGGKLDRRALPSTDCSRPELDTPLVEPGTPCERVLCELWSEVLDVAPVGVRDNVLFLGADSLSIFQLVNRIQKRLGVDIGVSTIFAALTVEDLARAIETDVAPARNGH